MTGFGTASHSLRCALVVVALLANCAKAEWRRVYSQSFDKLAAGTKTTSKQLPEWEAGSASGTVFDGKTKHAGRFLVASSAWTSFNQGPILNLDLSATPHDKVRVSFDLYTFGDWRGMQRSAGGPQHRLMFFDNKAQPTFAFDTNFATNPEFKQSWPDRNPKVNKARLGAKAINIDATGRYNDAYRWTIKFEYTSDSPSLRFAILCGAAAGSGKPMPHFGIDNVRVSVHSTAPVIHPNDLPDEIRLAENSKPQKQGTAIKFEVKQVGRISVGVFDKKNYRLIRTLLSGETLAAGEHETIWDGRDNRGRRVPKGEYQWRLISSPGLSARYITTIGVNPPGGETPDPSKSWVGDHAGAGIVDVDETGVYVGSPMTEGGRMILKCDSSMSKVLWSRPQFYQSGRLTRIATNGQHVFMVHPNGKLRRLNRDNGRVEKEWQVKVEDIAPSDLDAARDSLVTTYPQKNLVRWLSIENGKTVKEMRLDGATAVAVSGGDGGEAFVSSGGSVYRIDRTAALKQVAKLDGTIGAMDYDRHRKELWAVVDGHRVVRFDSQFKITRTYSDKPRELGPFDPTQFAGIYDIAADLKGGFFIGEPGQAPRRIAHIGRDGSLIDQWFGGMSFYISGTFDPDDPSRMYGIAPEGWVNVYKIDFETGRWDVEACYLTGRLGDSMFPYTGAFRAVRRNGQLYLYHRVLPAVIRLDPKLRRAIPVAIAGRVINRGRTFMQFAGSGRDGYPKPWVAAAEHHGFQDLNAAPKLYSWADTNNNGEFDPSEFKFYPNAKVSLSFHNVGDFKANGDYIGTGKTNDSHAMVRLPVARWEGPDKTAPRWDWDGAKRVGEIVADSYGWGSPRGLSVGDDGAIAVAYQAGIMIRAHGQYEGGGWPESGLKGSRVLGFDDQFQSTFAAGRQSKIPSEANTGVLYYPMQTTAGPNNSVIVNDQTKQPGQVWTHDGLYVGSFFDNRADDGLPDGFYRVHGDDNQGCTLVTTKSGKTCWLMPYQGHNRLYEISGWDWKRSSGIVSPPSIVDQQRKPGTGLTAKYFQGDKLVFQTIESPIYYEKFGPERHSNQIKPITKSFGAAFSKHHSATAFSFAAFWARKSN